MFKHRSVDCFRLGWPMRADADFFCKPIEQIREKNEVSVIPLSYLLEGCRMYGV